MVHPIVKYGDPVLERDLDGIGRWLATGAAAICAALSNAVNQGAVKASWMAVVPMPDAPPVTSAVRPSRRNAASSGERTGVGCTRVSMDVSGSREGFSE